MQKPTEQRLVLPPTEYEQRSQFYKDIEGMVFPGFLAHPIKVAGVAVVLRSLGPGDLFLLRMRTADCSEWHRKLWMVASSIWMVDGHVILDMPHRVPWIKRVLAYIPEPALDILFTLVLGLFVRKNQAVDGVEAFCYESRSRSLWSSFGGQPPREHTGIPGIAKIGTNYLQRMWVAYNVMEDARISDNNQWVGFKLVASTMAPKGLKKINTREAQEKEQEGVRRQGVMDVFFYQCLGVLPKTEVSKKASRQVHPSQKSPDDLEGEMRRWIAGEEDWHDRVVTEWKDAVLAQKAEVERIRHSRMEAIREKERVEVDEDWQPQPMVAYSTDQLAAILKDRKPGVGWIPSDQDVKKFMLAEKYLERKADSGQLQVHAGKISGQGRMRFEGDNVIYTEGSKDGYIPEGGGLPRDLQNQVASRYVPFSSGSDDEEAPGKIPANEW